MYIVLCVNMYRFVSHVRSAVPAESAISGIFQRSTRKATFASSAHFNNRFNSLTRLQINTYTTH